VKDAYLEHFQYLDPVRTILPQLFAKPFPKSANANTPTSKMSSSLMVSGSALPTNDCEYRRSLSQYWKEFLRPNNLYHHAGFLLRGNDRRAWLLNFHRPHRAAAFNELELARVKLIGGILQAQVGVFTEPNTETDLILAPLSARERHVCDAIAQGMSNKQIADTLRISVRTVENHLRNIYRKLGVVSRTQLTSLFLRH
jgi:DNA-binding CsgD family transcriptional regulator